MRQSEPGIGRRRLGRREPSPVTVDDRPAAPGAPADLERRRLLATIQRLRVELARMRGELADGSATPTAPGAALAEPEPEAPERAAEAEERAREAEHRVRLLAEELAAERRLHDELRARLTDAEARLVSALSGLEQVEELRGALAEERESRAMLETLRDRLEAAIEDQRRLDERTLADVQTAAEAAHAEQAAAHRAEVEELQQALRTAEATTAELDERLRVEAAERARVEERTRALDTEIDELRSWIAAADRRRRSLLRRSPLPPVPGRTPPPLQNDS